MSNTPSKSRWRHVTGTPRTRAVAVATGIFAVVIAPLGVAATGDSLREGKRNGTTRAETEIVSNIAASTGKKGGYATRQSNLSSSGGGAVYGCRSASGGSAATSPQNPCIRSNNLSTGFSFEFNATNGDTAGLITVGAGGDTKKPFTTNATGVATGLNADRVDGANASDIVAAAQAGVLSQLGATGPTGPSGSNGVSTRFFSLDEAGKIIDQSGGFTIIDAYTTNTNVYVDSGQELAGHGLTASINLQNKIDQTADGTADPNFGGEASVARCQTDAVECAPAGAKNTKALVVSPRNPDGTATTATTRKRVTVFVTP